jgi:hypothetical protein
MCSQEHYRMSNFSIGSRSPDFDMYYAAVDKQSGQVAVVGLSAPGVLAEASNQTSLPKDRFEVHQITKEEYEALRR